MRVKSKDINLNESAPTQVTDMKEGELRFAGDMMYGRVGNQILSVDCGVYFPTTTTTTTTTTTPAADFFYDDFGDGSLDPAWSYQNGPAPVEASSRLTWTLTGGGPNYESFTGAPFTQPYFDVYGKVETAYDSNFTKIGFYVRDITKNHWAAVFYTNYSGSGTSYANGQFYDGDMESHTDYENFTNNILWLRARYQPGDSGVRLYYKIGDPAPTIEGDWTEIVASTNFIVPDSGNLRFEITAYYDGPSGDWDFYCYGAEEWTG